MLADGKMILLTDTVGFIRKLPPTIVTSFRATLEELNEATILLHVVDFSSPDAAEQCQTVEDILAELNLSSKPVITALNKIDLLLSRDREWNEEDAIKYFSDLSSNEEAVPISATKRWGLARLLELISQKLAQPTAAG